MGLLLLSSCSGSGGAATSNSVDACVRRAMPKANWDLFQQGYRPTASYLVDVPNGSIDLNDWLQHGLLEPHHAVRTVHVTLVEASPENQPMLSPAPGQRAILQGKTWRRYAETSTVATSREQIERQARAICRLAGTGVRLVGISVTFTSRDRAAPDAASAPGSRG